MQTLQMTLSKHSLSFLTKSCPISTFCGERFLHSLTLTHIPSAHTRARPSNLRPSNTFEGHLHRAGGAGGAARYHSRPGLGGWVGPAHSLRTFRAFKSCLRKTMRVPSCSGAHNGPSGALKGHSPVSQITLRSLTGLSGREFGRFGRE